MLGVALNAQRAGWSGGPAKANMVVVNNLLPKSTQTPSYSWEYAVNAPGTLKTESSSGLQGSANAYVDLSGYSSLTGADNRAWTMATTFYLDWQSGLNPGPGNYIMCFFHGAKFAQPPTYPKSNFWGLNCFAQFRDDGQLDITARMETDFGIYRATANLPGPYTDYCQRWLTYIYSGTSNKTNFANWTGESGTYDYYTRYCLYDTQTQEKIQTVDLGFTPSGGFPQFLSYSGSNLYFNNSLDTFIEIGVGGVGDQYQREPVRVTNAWASYGTMFDPGNIPDTSIFTARPSAKIGNADAWYNFQETENVISSSNYYWKAQGMDRFHNTSDLSLQLTGGTLNGYSEADQWGFGNSTTIKPKASP